MFSTDFNIEPYLHRFTMLLSCYQQILCVGHHDLRTITYPTTSEIGDMQTHTYEKRTTIATSLERITAFHQSLDTMPLLAPPPIFIRIQRDDRISLTEGELDFTLWFGPIPIRWLARHQPGPTEYAFTDLMVKGPMAYWRHDHIFEEVPDGVVLIDRVHYAHKFGITGMFTHLMFDGLPLRALFFYRHLRTRMALNGTK
jgi:ligand-binding SRPBCC domain-containing protein